MGSRTLAGRYELLEKIGDGGMAVVYKGRDKLLNRFVAVKILKPELTKDIKFIDSFRRESQAAASLSHPNIVNVYDVGREGNIHYIVMELIDGRVLSDVIKEEGPMKPRTVVEVGKQIASALSQAHKNQIIHRDVKPHNILLMDDGTAKITDFGIAKAVNTATIMGNTGTGTVMGSVHYFSPEQARGGYVDEKSDIYSLGIVLYEMITGEVPFDAENPVAVALMHINEEMRKPSELRAGIPHDLEEIIIKATNKYQINRFKSAEEMYEALDKARLSDILYYGGNENNKGLDATMMMAAVNRGSGAGGAAEDGDFDVDGGGAETAEAAGSGSGEAGSGSGGGAGAGTGGNKHGKVKKVNKKKIGIVVAALLIAIPLSIFLVNSLLDMNTLKEVIVPGLEGKTVEEAQTEVEGLGLDLQIANELNSAEYEAGQIISQDPAAEMKVKEGYVIKVTVSKGIAPDTVPNVVGKTESDAVFILENYGYKVGEVKEEHHEYPEDIIFRQSPEGGDEAEKGTTVNLYVSLGEEKPVIPMPDLLGKPVEEADAIMKDLKLELGVSSFASSDEYAEDVIIGQTVEAGTDIEEGTAVDITVSTGPDLSGPVSIPIYIPYDSAPNDVFTLTVVVSDGSGVQTVINQEQRLKSNGSETITLSGIGTGTVAVIFDNIVTYNYSVNFDTGEVY